MDRGLLFQASHDAEAGLPIERCTPRVIVSALVSAFFFVAMSIAVMPDAYAQRGMAAGNAMRSNQLMRQQQRQQQIMRQQRQLQRQQQMRRQREQQAQRQRVIKRQREIQKQRQLVRQKQIKARQQAQRKRQEQARKRQLALRNRQQSTGSAAAIAVTARRTGAAASSGSPTKHTKADAKRSTRLAALRKPGQAAKSGGVANKKPGQGKSNQARSQLAIKQADSKLQTASTAPRGPNDPPKLTPIFNAAARNTLASKVNIVGKRLKSFNGKITKKSVGMSGAAANMRAEFRRTGSDPKTDPDGAKQRAPYAAAGRAREIVLKKDREFVRVHGTRNQQGGWIMRAKDIKGLTPAQIKDKYALPETPLLVSKVKVPAGTRLQVGRAAGQKNWGKGGNTQYEIKDSRLSESAFSKAAPLKGAFSKPVNTNGATARKIPPAKPQSAVTAKYGNTNFSKPANGPTKLGTDTKPGSSGISATKGTLKNAPPSGALSKQFDAKAKGVQQSASSGSSSGTASGNQPVLKPKDPTF